jgi:hypothetical protein
MKKKNLWMGILAITLVFGMTITSCDNDSGGGGDVPPENKPVAERWVKWVDPTSTATLDYSVANDGVCTITVGGTAQPNNETDDWGRWKVAAQYNYTSKANTNYTYVFEAWTESGNREFYCQYYLDNDIRLWFGELITITDTRTTFTIMGDKIPKNGVRTIDFQCADQLGTFYVKIISITEVPTNSGGTYTLQWGSTLTSYSRVESIIATQGWNIQRVGDTAAYATKATATSIYNWCIDNAYLYRTGIESGSFESLVNYSSNGVSAPPALKTALNSNKANVPLAGIFDGGSVAVLFYITKN